MSPRSSGPRVFLRASILVLALGAVASYSLGIGPFAQPERGAGTAGQQGAESGLDQSQTGPRSAGSAPGGSASAGAAQTAGDSSDALANSDPVRPGTYRPATRSAELLRRRPKHPERYLALPDRTWIAPLNGVREPAAFDWPKKRPYSPIVSIETDDDGTDWYVHADQSRSTTRMVWHSQLQKADPMTSIYNPATPRPILPRAGLPAQLGPQRSSQGRRERNKNH